MGKYLGLNEHLRKRYLWMELTIVTTGFLDWNDNWSLSSSGGTTLGLFL